MGREKVLRVVGLAVVSMFVLAACGQKSGVHAAGAGLVGEGGVPIPGATGPGGVPIPGATGPGGVPIPGATGPGGVPVPGATGGGGPPVVVGGDRTGITDKEIIIGIHAPVTGAAPVQGAAFEAGAKLYWNWLKGKGQKVFGRDVRVVFRDDAYSPTQAVAVCNQMATSDKAFLLIGGAGTDQINACAGYADQRSIPYLSPGVQEAGLSTRRSYFAVTLSYKQQMPLLAQLLKKENSRQSLNKYGGGGSKVKVGFVRPNTPNFSDADQAFKAAITGIGFEYKTYNVSKEGRSDEAQTVAAQMQADNVDVAVPITPPVFTIQLAINTGKNDYRPLYAGVAITNNINQAIDFMCKNNEFDDAIFFSPWPGWKNVMAKPSYERDFADAAQKYAPNFNKRTKGGDILLALWGIMKTVHKMFLAAGATMSRQSFVQTLNNFSLSTGVFPRIAYSPANHLGAKETWVLKGSCTEAAAPGVDGGAQWVTHEGYKGLHSGF